MHDKDDIELLAETEIDTESEGGQLNVDNDDEEYSPMVNSKETPIDEDGDTDFVVCPIPNLNWQFRYLRAVIKAAVEASQERCKWQGK